jgi:FkbM family methyltransferase
MPTTIPASGVAELLQEYERLERLCADGPDGPGRTATLGWDLEYTSPTALLSFVDQILFRGLNDFATDAIAPVIVDCGANIGYTALHYKRRYPSARIISFEPDPEFLPLLQVNLQRNGASDVQVVPAAAWIRDGEALWVMEGKDGSRLADAPSGQRTTTVRTVDLRTFLADPVDLLKLDIEGAEFEVVPHLRPVLHRVQNVVIECHINNQSHYAGLALIMTSLAEAGFQISVNTYGSWRDLIRRPVPQPLHAEQYLVVYGWRGHRPPPSTEETLLPYVGLTHYRQLQRAARVAGVEQHLHDVGRTIAGLLAGRTPTTLHRICTPVRRERGHCWYYLLPESVPAGDSSDSPSATTVVMEDDRVLGPGHAAHDDVRITGGGLYSHWNRQLYFSTSDNSDPNKNGRAYTIITV